MDPGTSDEYRLDYVSIQSYLSTLGDIRRTDYHDSLEYIRRWRCYFGYGNGHSPHKEMDNMDHLQLVL